MYASEFLQKELPNINKVFLSGENTFVRGLVIDKLIQGWGVTEAVNVTKSSDLKVYGNYTIFGPKLIAYIFGNKVEPKEGLNFVIKISSKKITQKYKSLGFCEIICSDFFPNQIEAFCQQYLTQLSVNLPTVYTKFICVSCGYDMVAITNTAKMLSFLDQAYVQSLSYQDFALICGRLSVSEETVIVNHFIDGEYAEFLDKLNENPRLSSAVLWGLVFTLLRVRDTMCLTKNPTWFQRRQIACGKRMEHYGLDRVIVFTSRLAESFSLKFPQIMLDLNRLIKCIKGELNVMAGLNK
jgi:hypothetical protein